MIAVEEQGPEALIHVRVWPSSCGSEIGVVLVSDGSFRVERGATAGKPKQTHHTNRRSVPCPCATTYPDRAHNNNNYSSHHQSLPTHSTHYPARTSSGFGYLVVNNAPAHHRRRTLPT